MKRFTLFLSNMRNSLLTKDVGVIPFLMGKYYGYDSNIISMKTEEPITYNKKYLENMPVSIIKDNNHLEEELKRTDTLMLIGLYDFNINVASLYKKINPFGKIYLKLDASLYWMYNISKHLDDNVLTFLRICDVISVESRRLQFLLSAVWNVNVRFIPNGYYNFNDIKNPNEIINYYDKENIILFSGRVGSIEKNNILLLEAFKNVANKIDDWKIEFAGPVEDNFLIYLNNYFKENPELKDKVKLSGKHERSKLKKIYEKAKVFCLTSNTEACANVFSEAISNGCYIIATDVDGAIDIIDYGRHGSIVPVCDVNKLSQTLLEVCSNNELLKDNCEKSQIYSRQNLDWVKICGDINNLIS